MASYLPPDSYPREQGVFWGRCGSTWDRRIKVTGWVQSLKFGDQFSAELFPLATDEEVAAVGRDSPQERELFQELDERRQYFAGLAATAPYLKPAQRASIQELLDRVDELVELIGDVYRKWERFPCFSGLGDESPVCAWPLSWADNVGAWRQRCGELPFEPGKSYTAYDVVSGTQRTFTCPISPGSTLARLDGSTRAEDRKLIRDITRGILHHLRCAQYTLKRLQLYRRAWSEYRETQMKGTWLQSELPDPDSLAGELVTGFVYSPPQEDGPTLGAPPSPPPPDDEDGLPPEDDEEDGLPPEDDEEDPFDLPDPDSLPPVDEGPDAEGAPDSPDSSDNKALKYGAIGLGIAAVGALAYKGLKK